MRRVIGFFLAWIGMTVGLAALPAPAGAEWPGVPATSTGCEGTSDGVARLYAAGLGRAPDGGGFTYWFDKYERGEWTLPRMAGFFVDSAEFRQRHGDLDDAGFVDVMYRNVLGRAADPDGRTYWTAQLANGNRSRATVLLNVSESPENISRTGTAAPTLGRYNVGRTGGWICSGETATVTGVVDGDTFDVTIAGRSDRVRLIGIDTPERGECLADEATAELTRLLAGGTVRMTADTNDRDRFGRLLRYVEADGVLVNTALVRSGLADAKRYEPDTARAVTFERAEAEAIAAGRGIWTGCTNPAPAEPPADAPAEPGQAALSISTIRYDAPGNDNHNQNEEWIVIRNDGSATARLTGWSVHDDGRRHTYRFPSGYQLGAGASVTIRTGCGTDTAANLHWCAGSTAVWNNGGDTGHLRDPDGTLVDTWAY